MKQSALPARDPSERSSFGMTVGVGVASGVGRKVCFSKPLHGMTAGARFGTRIDTKRPGRCSQHPGRSSFSDRRIRPQNLKLQVAPPVVPLGFLATTRQVCVPFSSVVGTEYLLLVTFALRLPST